MKVIGRVSSVLVTAALLATHVVQRAHLRAPVDAPVTYSSNFAASEDPLDEGGAWINGGTTGADWGNVASAAGLF